LHAGRIRAAASGVLVLAGCAGAATLPDPVAGFPRLLWFLVPATLGWLVAVGGVAPGPRSAPPRFAGRRFAAVVAVSLAARLLLLVPPEPLSDDLYRYLWDGRLGNAGVDPFAYAPRAAELAPYRDDGIWPRINHPEVPTIYPPVAQFAFRAMDAARPSPRTPRIAAVLFDLAAVLLLGLLLRQRGFDPSSALVYGWCPLAVLESGAGGHVDTLGVALLVGSLAAAAVARPARGFGAGLLLGLSTLVKPMAPLAAPAMWFAPGGRRRTWWVAGGAVAMLAALPYADAGARLFTGLRTYAEHWRFNDAIYSVLVAAGAGPRGTRLVLAASTIAFAVFAGRRWRDPAAAAACAIAVALALSPTVHPWYALWLVPLLPFAPVPLARAGTAFAALLPVTYAAAWSLARSGTWREPAWSRPLVWGVPAAVFLVTLARRRA
jgi:Glycosyltransferase family 87